MEEARRKANEILEAAKKEAEKIVRAAEEEWRRRAEQERQRILAEARARAQVIISEAGREARLMVSRKKNELVEKAFSEAWSRIVKGIGYDRRKSLKRLLEEALAYVPPGTKEITIKISPADAAIIDEALRELGRNLDYQYTIEKDESIAGGVIIVCSDGTVIDNSYNTRFTRSKETIVDQVSRVLWGTPGR